MRGFDESFYENSVLDAFLSDPDIKGLLADENEYNEIKKLVKSVRFDELEENGMYKPVKYKKLPDDKLIEISVSDDRMDAWIKLSREFYNISGEGLEILIKEELEKKGINYGVYERQLKRLAETPVFDVPILIAHGKEAVTDDYNPLELNFDNMLTIKPKNNDYSVDINAPDFVNVVSEGQLLCARHESGKEHEGIDVYGRQFMPVRQGINWAEAGDNVIVSKDGEKLFAGISGEIEFNNGILSIIPILYVDEVSENLDFDGSIYVKDSILSDCIVRASGNVIVGRIIENCRITAGTNIVAGLGIKGGGESSLKTKGSIRAPFLENVKAEVFGSVYTDVLLSSDILCEKGIYALGPKGRIIGGKCAAREIKANEFGNTSGTETRLEILSPELFNIRIEKDRNEYEAWSRRVDELTRMNGISGNAARNSAVQKILNHALKNMRFAEKNLSNTVGYFINIEDECDFKFVSFKAVYANVFCTLFGNLWCSSSFLPGMKLYMENGKIELGLS